MIEQNDVKASNSVNATLALLQGRGVAGTAGVSEQATGNFGQTFAKFTQKQSALLTDPSMLKAKVEPKNTPKKPEQASQASSPSRAAAQNGVESAKPKSAANAVEAKRPSTTDAPSQTKPDNRTDAQQNGPDASARTKNTEQAAKQTDDTGSAQNTDQAGGDEAAAASDTGEGAWAGAATEVVEAEDDVMLALAASDEQTQAVSEAPILAAQAGELSALDDAAVADTQDLPVEDLDLELDVELDVAGDTKRDNVDSEKTSKLNLRHQEGEAALRGLGERMGRQTGDGAAQGESHHRARAQMFAEALSQNGSNKPAIGAEKATGLVGAGATATSNALGLKSQAPLSGQAAAAESARYVTRLNTPFQQPAWTEMMQGRVMWMVQSELKTATVYIDPPELGPVHITIQQSGDQAQVNFQVQSQSVRESLEQSAHRLRESLGEQGFTQVDVNVRGGDGESGDAQGERSSGGDQSDAALASEASVDADGEQVAQIIRSDGTVGLVNTYA